VINGLLPSGFPIETLYTPSLSPVRATCPFHLVFLALIPRILYSSVSQPPGRGPVPGPGINYTGPPEVLLEFVVLVF